MLVISLTSFFNTIILLGIVQGIIVSCLLFFSQKNRYSNRILALLILLITMASFNLYGNYTNWFNSNLVRLLAQIIPLVMPMAFGPLIYFYTQSILEPAFSINKKRRRHFYPVLIDLVPSITFFVYGIGLLTKLVKNNPGPWGAFIDDYNVYADIPRWISITIYVWLSSKYLSAYKLKQHSGLNGQAVNFKWLIQLVRLFTIFQSIWLVYLVPYVIPRYSNWVVDTFDWYPIYIPMAILIYWMGIKGCILSQQPAVTKKANTAGTALPVELIEQVTTSLRKMMEERKAYLNPELNLATMAELTGFSQKIISSILNQYIQKSFNEFVNEYRVLEFKEKIMQPGTHHLTIAGIAFECGFGSQPTFQRVFKEITGHSPSEFRKTAIQTV